MSAARDPKLDALLTAPAAGAWQAIFAKLWEIFSAPLTAKHAEREVIERERRIADFELLLSGGAWELWREYESSLPFATQALAQFWNSTPSGKAILILDGLSLREVPWLLQEAARRSYKLHQAGARGSALPT